MHPADLAQRLEDPRRRLVRSDREEAAAYIRLLEEDLDRLRGALQNIARRYPCETAEHMSRLAREALPEDMR